MSGETPTPTGPGPDAAAVDREPASGENLKRGLVNRHIQLLAIGGAIGVGLFLGSASAIQEAGPAVLLCYCLAGGVVFFVLRALGEMAVDQPISGSVASYAHQYIGPWAGYATGWTYWAMWITTVMAELTAIGIYTDYFVPSIPQWIPGLVAVILFAIANLASARVFGEVEFWFALVKIVAIILFIVSGIVLILFSIGPLADQASFANLVDEGGFFPKGILGPLIALQIVTYSFLGVEMIGVTAGEAQNPRKVLPRAINGVAVRILLFYVLAIAIVLALIPWDEVGDESPFVLAWASLGIPAAASILNGVVIVSALSSSNSGVYTTTRMLFTLSRNGYAPSRLSRLSRRKVPSWGLAVSIAVLLIGVVLNVVVPAQAFAWITSVATVAVLWVWMMILVSHMRFRRQRARDPAVERSHFRMPGYPWTNAVALGYIALVFVLLGVTDDQRVALAAGGVWAIGLIAGWFALKRHNRRRALATAEPEAAAPQAP
jgi:AAT family amino acid transporter